MQCVAREEDIKKKGRAKEKVKSGNAVLCVSKAQAFQRKTITLCAHPGRREIMGSLKTSICGERTKPEMRQMTEHTYCLKCIRSYGGFFFVLPNFFTFFPNIFSNFRKRVEA